MLMVVLLVALDQLSKWGMSKIRTLGNPLHYSTNYGAIFGLMQGWRWLFVAISLIMIVFVLHYYKKEKDSFIRMAFALILAGTFGNLIDRLLFGYVRDFISFWLWPNFNLADIYTTVGVAMLVVALLKGRK